MNGLFPDKNQIVTTGLLKSNARGKIVVLP